MRRIFYLSDTREYRSDNSFWLNYHQSNLAKEVSVRE